MTIAAVINGSRVVVPSVRSSVTVEDNLANVAPGARNIVILGESLKGVPGSELDISNVFFNDYQSVKAFYGSGPIVDSARMIFSNQASPVFTGSIGRLYVYKTNSSTRSEKALLASAAAYASIVAAEYGEEGNLISAQIKTGTAEIKPTFTASWLMRDQSSTFYVRASGGVERTITVAAEALPSAIVTSINANAEFNASGGVLRAVISAGQVTSADELAVTISGQEITILPKLTGGGSASTFQGADIASVAVGEILYIPLASAIKGASNENVGAYVITAVSTTQIKALKLSHTASGVEVAYVAPVAVSSVVLAGVQTAVASAELMVFSPITISVKSNHTTAIGTGESLEVYMASGGNNLAQRFWSNTLLNPVSATAALSASVALSVSSGIGSFSITSGSFQNLPSAGAVLWVKPGSILAGASQENVGAWIVTSAGSTSIVATKVVGAGASVSSVSATETAFQIQSAIASTASGAKLHTSAAERKVILESSRQSDGLSFPAESIGGRVVLEVSYAGSAATLSISKAGMLTTSITGGSGADLSINLAQFATMGDLLAYINTKTGYAAKVSDNRFKSLAPKLVLDQVSAVTICSGHSVASYAGRIKADYYDFKSTVDNNFGLLAFRVSDALLLKAGLPDTETLPSFLAGGSIGSTNNAAIASGLDAALKIEVTQVVPLFSRDAAEDITDGLTDSSSNYTIDSINASIKSHVATANTVAYQKERFGVVSIHGSFSTSKQKASELSHERVQVAFQQVRAVASDGNIKWFLPWMFASAFAAGRVQAQLGTSMLRKSFQVASVKHVGALSLFSDVFVPDFDPDTKDLDEAIESGLLVLRPVTGFGVRLESPDLSSRSRDNDPKAWVYERVNVQFVLDEVVKTLRSTLDNYIGSRTTDVSPAVIRKALGDVLGNFLSNGSLKAFSIDALSLVGNTYKCSVSVFPVEAVEFLELNVLSRRDVG